MEYRDMLRRQEEWLATVKEGDKVISLHGRYDRLTEWLVIKITKTQIVCQNTIWQKPFHTTPNRYRREDGSLITADRWDRERLIDPEWAAELQEQKAKEAEYNQVGHELSGFSFDFGMENIDLMREALSYLNVLRQEVKTRLENKLKKD